MSKEVVNMHFNWLFGEGEDWEEADTKLDYNFIVD